MNDGCMYCAEKNSGRRNWYVTTDAPTCVCGEAIERHVVGHPHPLGPPAGRRLDHPRVDAHLWKCPGYMPQQGPPDPADTKPNPGGKALRRKKVAVR